LSAALAEPPSEPSRTPFATKIARAPQNAPAGAPSPFAPAAEKRTDDLPQRFPSVVRSGPARAPDDIAPAPRPFASAATSDDEERDVERLGPFAPRKLRAAGLSAASLPRVSARLDSSARAPLSAERPKSPAFDAVWPRGRRAAAQAAAPVEVPEIPEIAPAPVIEEQGVEPPPVMTPDDAPQPITVLKSGVVDGMAYTLYSDGSIEAQLPQGVLRFGSIAELRAHIEQDTQN
jgi:hypothetical protein